MKFNSILKKLEKFCWVAHGVLMRTFFFLLRRRKENLVVSATTTNSFCASLSSQLKKFYAIIQTSTKHSTISSSILRKNFRERGSPQKPSLALILQVKKKRQELELFAAIFHTATHMQATLQFLTQNSNKSQFLSKFQKRKLHIKLNFMASNTSSSFVTTNSFR